MFAPVSNISYLPHKNGLMRPRVRLDPKTPGVELLCSAQTHDPAGSNRSLVGEMATAPALFSPNPNRRIYIRACG